MGSDVDRQEPNATCVKAVLRAWKALPPRAKPKDPAALLNMLGDIYQYPHPDFLVTDGTGEKQKRLVADAFDAFVLATANLSAVLPRSTGWYALPSFLSERMPVSDEVLQHDLRILDELVHRIGVLKLPPFPKPGRTGSPLKSPRLRILSQMICWYLVRIEGEEKIKSGFNESTGAPTSKAAKLIAATCNGMGLHASDEEIKTQLNAVKNLNFNEVDFWDLISIAGSNARL